MTDWLQRSELLVKKEGLETLKNAKVLVVGLGGVGSFAAEFLARAGVGNMTIVDGDIVDITNINRQLPALHSTVGKDKVEIVAERILDINPEINLVKINEFLSPERMDEILEENKFRQCYCSLHCFFRFPWLPWNKTMEYFHSNYRMLL